MSNRNKIKLCKNFDVIRIIFPEIYGNSFIIYSDQLLMCSEMVILIIKSMALAIVVTKHDMQKFDYYNKKINYENFKRFNGTGAELVIIDEKWDTTNWNYLSLTWLPYWISDLHELNITDVTSTDTNLLFTKVNSTSLGFPLLSVSRKLFA